MSCPLDLLFCHVFVDITFLLVCLTSLKGPGTGKRPKRLDCSSVLCWGAALRRSTIMVWDSKYCRKGTDSTCLYISDGEEDVRFWILKATGGIHLLKKTVSLDKNVVKGFVPDLDEYLKESFRSLRIFTQTELRRSIPRWPRINFILLWKPVSGLSWPW